MSITNRDCSVSVVGSTLPCVGEEFPGDSDFVQLNRKGKTP